MNRVINIPNTEIKTIKLELVDDGDRFRKDYGDLTDLKFSIQTHGLINPISVMADGDRYRLVAGGRRLACLRDLQVVETPVRVFGVYDELQLRILELAENLQRKDMTWQEQNSLQREIHRLQQTAHGVSLPGAGGGWRLEDTAKMLGVSDSKVSESIKLGEKLDRYKAVLGDASRFKTENEARKAVKTVEEAMIRAELARRAEQKQSTNTFTQHMANSYIVGDFLEITKQYNIESFDFAEVDPPYGIDLEDIKKMNDCEGYTEIDKDEYLVFTKQVLDRVWRLLKPNTFCIYWFGQDPWFEYIYKIAREIGFTGSRIPMIWTKPNGQSLNPNSTLATAYETAFVFRKGTPVLGRPGRTNIFSYLPVKPQEKYHPTQKPIDLYQDIYETFSFEGGMCIVPFAGSGASLIGAALSKRKAVGFDLNQEFKGGYLQMVNSIFLQGK